MREIKYRAWVKEGTQPQLEGRTLPVESLEWDTKGQTLLYVITPDGEGNGWEVEIKNCELMQYTGMKDRDGREIYEGDIIEMIDKYRGFVEFNDGTFEVERRGEQVPYNKEMGGYIRYIDWPAEFYYNCKVIGNIYENPELIGDTN